MNRRAPHNNTHDSSAGSSQNEISKRKYLTRPACEQDKEQQGWGNWQTHQTVVDSTKTPIIGNALTVTNEPDQIEKGTWKRRRYWPTVWCPSLVPLVRSAPITRCLTQQLVYQEERVALRNHPKVSFEEPFIGALFAPRFPPSEAFAQPSALFTQIRAQLDAFLVSRRDGLNMKLHSIFVTRSAQCTYW